jgi:uncharacterized membrane protein
VRERPTARERGRRQFFWAGVTLGVGLGGFVDGIVLHQIMQWHHMLTDYGDHSSFPATSIGSLEENTVWDGIFHATTWVFVLVGVLLLWRAASYGRPVRSRGLVGLLMAGWGIFNLVEGVVNHHILTIHHVRDDVSEPFWWDLGFLAFGVLLVAVGSTLYRRDQLELVDLRVGADAVAHSSAAAANRSRDTARREHIG